MIQLTSKSIIAFTPHECLKNPLKQKRLDHREEISRIMRLVNDYERAPITSEAYREAVKARICCIWQQLALQGTLEIIEIIEEMEEK